MPITFTRYVLRFKTENSGIGDVARDLLEDPRIKRTWGYTRLRKHLLENGACDDALERLEEAYLDFFTSQAWVTRRPGSPAVQPTEAEPTGQAPGSP